MRIVVLWVSGSFQSTRRISSAPRAPSETRISKYKGKFVENNNKQHFHFLISCGLIMNVTEFQQKIYSCLLAKASFR